MKTLLKSLILLAFLSVFATDSYAQLGGPPKIIVQPLGLSVLKGGTAVITTTATSLTSMNLTWYCNGKKLSGNGYNVLNVAVPLVGTVSTLTINNITPANEGYYSVQAQNGSGTVTSSNATLLVLSQITSNAVGFLASGLKKTERGLQLTLTAPTGSNVVIHASSDLMHWTPISTNTATSGTVTYTDTNALNVTVRFYRAVLQ
jgi:hypothetical protein